MTGSRHGSVDEPFDETFELAGEPTVVKDLGGRAAQASQWRLVFWKFRRHHVAVVATFVVLTLYLIGIFAEFIAPYSPQKIETRYTYAPPQALSLITRDSQGGWQFQPHVKGYTIEVDPVILKRTFVIDSKNIIPVGLFVKGESYQLFGLIPMDRHLIGPVNPADPMFLMGTDRIGRDLFSRLVYGTRISMSIGLVGVIISLALGILLGGLSGYYGGAVDTIIQRVIEILSSIPTIPLWMGLAAAIPLTWSPLSVYFTITLIISLIGWTALGREVRGRFYALRSEDFVTAARLDGSSELRVVLRHMVPSITSHIVASITLAIPAMILAETSLSFLGIGLKPPVVSWGVLLQDAQNIRSVSTAPWLLIAPGLAVVTAVLAFNFMGDGLRDAADPYND
ncbi:MAG: ABC transporter permease [Pseudomonadota bacterium]